MNETEVETGAPPAGPLAGVARAAMIVAAVALVLLVVIQAWQVLARYVLNDSPGWTEPLSALCMTTAMMLGAAVAVRDDRHFGFVLALQAAPPRVQRWLQGVSVGVTAALGALLAFWGGVLTLDAIDVPMAGVALPQGLLFAPVAIGGALIALFALARFGREAR
jgi:TRAP-type C4-dicarboxylate transport system permease small subunit